jgi:cellulose synthase/poly-beta-1,6-N-acetylglucosamine synthase-like glycosyltransferase
MDTMRAICPTPSVSVIIPHFNDLENLRTCLTLLTAQSMPTSEFEIIVADNNSACGIDAVRAICGEQVLVVNAPLQGAAAARNTAVAASRGSILAFIDSDCRPTRDWLAHGVAALATADMVGGQVEVAAVDDRNPTPVEAFEKVFAFNFQRYIEAENFAGSGNMFVKRTTFETVGGFRAEVSEDKDWGQRAARLGYRWTYAPSAKVAHPARRTWPELREKWRRVTRETYMIMRPQQFGRVRWFFRAWAVLVSPFVHWLQIVRSQKLQSLSDKFCAIGVLFRIRWWRFLEAHRILFSEPGSK